MRSKFFNASAHNLPEKRCSEASHDWSSSWLPSRDLKTLHARRPGASTRSLPHGHSDQGRAPVRDLWAVAERPDGTRVAFMPYPTPIISNGQLLGAVNILVDITDPAQAQALLAQASRSRRLARAVNDDDTA